MSTAADRRPWYRELTRYHWFVFVVAALGWLFDTMDQQLFNIARVPAMRALLGPAPVAPAADASEEERAAYKTKADDFDKDVGEYSGYATSIFLIGWGTGGIAFGIVGDLIGRAKAMMLTVLLYSMFTGLSALSTGFWDFAFYRFLTGIGVGGEFGVGVSLVAEAMPDRARPFALGLLQALSAIGNMMAAAAAIALAYLSRAGIVTESWRVMFVLGVLPALLVVFIFLYLKEPERWRKMAAEESIAARLGAYRRELFGNPRWARNAIIGLLLASSGIVGLWAIGFFSIDLQRGIFRAQGIQDGLVDAPGDKALTFHVDLWAGWTSMMLNLGAFFGIYAFSLLAARTGRRPAFALSFILALLSTALVFWKLASIADIFWMIPLMGFCQLALFGGYAIYFPELFPTRLRSTGISFCYNGARFVAAAGPTVLGLLRKEVFGWAGDYAMRYAGLTMCGIFLVGLLALPFAPETKGHPLPE
jgi:MFS family permease